jgi:hypothetical protein
MIFLFYLRVRSGRETSQEIFRIRSGLDGVEGHGRSAARNSATE